MHVYDAILCGCLQCDLRKHITRLHGNLAADQQEELLTFGKLSNAELAKNEASSVCSNSVTVCVKPRPRAADRHNAAVILRQKRQRQKTSNFHNDFASSSSLDFGDCYKAEPVRMRFQNC